MHLGYLWELLEQEERACFEQLLLVQASQNHRANMPPVLREALAIREGQLIRELAQLKRVRLTTPVSKAVVVFTCGGNA